MFYVPVYPLPFSDIGARPSRDPILPYVLKNLEADTYLCDKPTMSFPGEMYLDGCQRPRSDWIYLFCTAQIVLDIAFLPPGEVKD